MPARGAGEAIVASVVDVGSNTVLLLTLRVAPDGRARAVDAALATTQLGAGLRDGAPLDVTARARTRDAVVEMARRARARGAWFVWAFATGAARRASDGHAFAAQLACDAGCAVEVLTGEREAMLAYEAMAHALGGDGRSCLAVDVGGATTELTLGQGGAVEATVSLPLGVLALTERSAEAPALVDAALATTDLPARARTRGAGVVGSGGTATALAALDLGLSRYDPVRVHGHPLAVAHLSALAAGAARAGADVLDPGRAPVLPAGACVLEHVARAAGADTVRASEHGVRHAYLRQRLAAEGVDADLRALWD
jgi:exopolyphosphatase / guanosine-5'-triphosphate,3'-diphosphate pyrophosphatase